MDTAQEVFVGYLTHQRLLVDFFYIAAAALVVYDYLLTLHLEVTLVWKSSWRYTNFVFLFVRYLPFIYIWFGLTNQVILDVTESRCPQTFAVTTWVMSFGMLFTTSVLNIRSWAVWRRNKFVGALLILLVLGGLAGSAVTNVKFSDALEFSPRPYPGFRGCYVTHTSSILRVEFIINAVLEAVNVILMTISAIKTHHSGTQSQLLGVLHQDGMLFYVHLLFSTVVTVLFMWVLPLDLSFMLIPVTGVLYSVLTCRVIFNIRLVAKQGKGVQGLVTTELHDYFDREVMTPLEFRPGDGWAMQSIA